jgi:4,5-dihydroxyphthalate decarboxylase
VRLPPCSFEAADPKWYQPFNDPKSAGIVRIVRLDLRITFRKTPHTEALLDGRVQSDRVNLQFVPVEPISRAFRRALRNDEFDVSEMALVTLAMARDAGLPWKGLPVVVLRGFTHGALRVPKHSDVREPGDLRGRTIGVRAYSQTTGVWVRGILETEYGVTPESMRWMTAEDAHVASFSDPPYVHRAPETTTLHDLLNNGNIDGVIGDSSSNFGETRSAIPNPEAASAAWFEKTGVIPINHVISLRSDLAARHPWLPGEIQALFEEAKGRTPTGSSQIEYGRAPHERAINLGLTFAHAQRLIVQSCSYDDLFF